MLAAVGRLELALALLPVVHPRALVPVPGDPDAHAVAVPQSARRRVRTAPTVQVLALVVTPVRPRVPPATAEQSPFEITLSTTHGQSSIRSSLSSLCVPGMVWFSSFLFARTSKRSPCAYIMTPRPCGRSSFQMPTYLRFVFTCVCYVSLVSKARHFVFVQRGFGVSLSPSRADFGERGPCALVVVRVRHHALARDAALDEGALERRAVRKDALPLACKNTSSRETRHPFSRDARSRDRQGCFFDATRAGWPCCLPLK